MEIIITGLVTFWTTLLGMRVEEEMRETEQERLIRLRKQWKAMRSRRLDIIG
jgi:steroid 5-alpha reductase family enzyme